MPLVQTSGFRKIPKVTIDELEVATITQTGAQTQTGDLTITGDLTVNSDAAGSVPVKVNLFASQTGPAFELRNAAADAHPTFKITAAARLQFGAGGASAVDCDFYRASAGVMRFDATQVVFGHNITLDDTRNIVLASTTGTKIGTATTQKLAFYNATPIVQPSAYTQTFATADKTHAARTATALTAASGTADGTVDDVGGAFNQTTLNNNFQECATRINQLIADLADTAGVVNALVDDLQALGLAG